MRGTLRSSTFRPFAPTPALVAVVLAAAVHVSAPPAAVADARLDTGLLLIERNYLFQDEVDPTALLREALAYISREFDDVYVEPLADDAFLVGAGNCELRVQVPPHADAYALERPLSEVGALLDACARRPNGEPASPDTLLLSGALAALDPYSSILDGSRHVEHNIQFRGQLAGIGARIGKRDERLLLLTVYPGSPAYRAGLRDGDVVLRIDNVSTTNILVTDAVEHIRGRVGSTVVLRVEREGKKREFTVTRGLVTIPSVTASLRPDGVLVAEISHFSQTTPDDFRTQVAKFLASAAVKGIVIDLRRNSGGSMVGSASIGDLFLRQGTLITTAGRDGQPVPGLSAEIAATSDAPFATLPVAFLTSRRTASGSELLAASLRNHDRAIIVGERSFGKGTVQKTYRLGPETAMKLTVGHFLPNKEPLPGGGLVPDVAVATYRLTDSGSYVPEYRSEQLPFWLRTPKWAKLRTRLSTVTLVGSTIDAPGEQEPNDENAPDRVRDVAAEILARFGNDSASVMLEQAHAYLADRARAADADLTATLASRGVDWTPGKSPSQPSLAARLEIDGGVLKAGEKRTVSIRLTNRSAEPMYRVRGMVDSKAGILNGRGLIYGRLDPGQTRSWSFEVEPGPYARTGRLGLTLDVFDDHGHLAELGPMFTAVQSAERPVLRYCSRIVPDAEASELSVEVKVQNRGRQSASNLRVALEHSLADDFELIDGSKTIETLEPGQTRSLSLRVRLLRSDVEPPLTKLAIVDRTYALELSSMIGLAPQPAFGPWLQAPEIRLERIRSTGKDDGQYIIDAVATDERGLSSVVTRIDGLKINYSEAAASASAAYPKRLRWSLPWNPSEGVKRLEVIATDIDGLKTSYVSGL